MNTARALALSLTLLALPRPLLAQARLLQSGPMVGYSEMKEVLLWVQTNAAARVSFAYWDTAAPGRRYRTTEVATAARSAYTAKIVADSVQPGRRYAYELYINGERVQRPYPLRFQTQKLWQWREDPPPFRFVIASCFYVNDPPYDRPGEPYGGGFEILSHLYAKRPDAMLWLGDNVYLREADWWSRTGIMYRYTHSRSLPELQPLLGATHHYAIWDDHDYGPNDSDRTFREKETTLEAFTTFWGNPSAGIAGVEGITTTFEWADVQFFLMDDRWSRMPEHLVGEGRRMLGKKQLDWLIEALASSQAPFKLVAIGSQVLNPVARFEHFSTFPEDREELLTRIRQQNITGVVFLSGDVHHTSLSKLERGGTYPLYDITISPLTAGIATGAANEANYLRVPNTVVIDRNFATLDFSGPRTDRQMVITVYDTRGEQRWQHTIKASELR
ncbi:MAG TPA: alkaline phosphatase D family protein [Gemmatimonadaceae bacterium]|nr:alkaline phosphatase D family protein [Gemmatimonadaceae bacterium]